MEEKVLQILQETLETDNIDNTCSQENCENWDSLHHLNLVVELEAAFGVEFEPEEIAEMTSMNKILALLTTKNIK